MRGLTLLGALALATPALATGPADAGKAIYDKHCSQCHGEQGDGKGPAAPHLRPRPRDFTSGKFKIRTTPNGALPTDDDLKSIIKRGMPYSSMPAWPQFNDQELAALVAYIKTFNAGFADPAQAPKKLDLGATPAFSKESAEKGAKTYASLGCAGCHGEAGHADGPSAPSLKDDAGNPLRAADLTMRWTFRGGARREDIFRTLSTGLNGTPMPSFLDALKPEERWQLTDFIASLGAETPDYASLLVASPLEEDFDLAKGAAQFEKAPPSRFPIVGQIMEPGRAFFPAATSVVVRAVYDQKRIAFLVTWHDSHADSTGKNGPDLAVPAAEEEDGAVAPAAAGGDDFWGEAAAPAKKEEPKTDDFWGDSAPEASAGPKSEFSDAVAIQLPAALPTGAAKPYFLFGDGQNATDLWFLDLAAGRPRQIVGRGSSSLTVLEGSEIEAQGKYEKGEWAAVFVRDLRSPAGVSFAEDLFVPVAFSIWDGGARERGSRRGITQWSYVYVPPRERPSLVGPMAGAAAGVAVLELLVVLALRRRRQAAPAPVAVATNGGA
jgi:mono/diheme cytochrome c family protein